MKDYITTEERLRAPTKWEIAVMKAKMFAPQPNRWWKFLFNRKNQPGVTLNPELFENFDFDSERVVHRFTVPVEEYYHINGDLGMISEINPYDGDFK